VRPETAATVVAGDRVVPAVTPAVLVVLTGCDGATGAGVASGIGSRRKVCGGSGASLEFNAAPLLLGVPPLPELACAIMKTTSPLTTRAVASKPRPAFALAIPFTRFHCPAGQENRCYFSADARDVCKDSSSVLLPFALAGDPFRDAILVARLPKCATERAGKLTTGIEDLEPEDAETVPSDASDQLPGPVVWSRARPVRKRVMDRVEARRRWRRRLIVAGALLTLAAGWTAIGIGTSIDDYGVAVRATVDQEQCTKGKCTVLLDYTQPNGDSYADDEFDGIAPSAIHTGPNGTRYMTIWWFSSDDSVDTSDYFWSDIGVLIGSDLILGLIAFAVLWSGRDIRRQAKGHALLVTEP
jgi:hypothetical protein